jgi:hypothetical protein
MDKMPPYFQKNFSKPFWTKLSDFSAAKAMKTYLSQCIFDPTQVASVIAAETN